MKRIGLLGAIALLTATVPSTPVTAIPDSWVQEEDFPGAQGETCEFGKTQFTCYFRSRGECQYWLSQTRRTEIFPGETLGRCVPANPFAPEGAEWEFSGQFN
jgi:hypothetical protein